MKIERILSPRMKGDDVRQLHSELERLGYSITDKEAYFGKTTRRAVLDFQERHALDATGIVDEATAARITRELSRLRRQRACRQLSGDRGRDASGGNYGRIELVLRDPSDELIHDLAHVALTNTRISSRNRRFEIRLEGEPVVLEDVPAHPNGFYHVAIRPTKYRYTAAYVGVGSDQPVWVEKTVAPRAEKPAEPIALTRAELLELRRLRELTPVELSRQAPELFARIESLAHGRIRAALQARFAGDERLLRLVEKLRLPGLLDPDLDLFEELCSRGRLSETARERWQEGLAALRGSGLFNDPLGRDTPSKDNPPLRGALHRGRVFALAESAGLDPERAEAVVDELGDQAELDEAVLGSLVAAGHVAAEEAVLLGLSADLADLCRDDLTLVEAVRPQVDGLPGLATWTAERWAGEMEAAEIIPPDGMTHQAYADELTGELTTLYPDLALLGRVRIGDPHKLAGELEGMAPKDRERLVQRYPGLQLGELLADPDLDPVQQAEAIVTRVGLVAQVQDDNPETDLLELDYSWDSDDFGSLDFRSPEEGGPSAEEKQMVRNNLAANRRIYRLAGNAGDARKVIDAGYDSAISVYARGRHRLATATALETDARDRLYRAAAEGVARMIPQIGRLIPVPAGGGLSWLDPPEDLGRYLRQIPGYSDLFGAQSACRCRHCRSVLGPAAYFVDLMRFVKPVLDRAFAENEELPLALRGESHPLHLEHRRPGLWALELTCDNTLERIPTLDIINEIFEDYVAIRHGYSSEPDELENRAAVEALVYRETLGTSAASFRQPFLLPLERLDIYLTHFGRTRADVARVLEAGADVVVAASLGVCLREYQLITRYESDNLVEIYGFDFTDGSGRVRTLEAQQLLEAMGVTRQQLGELLAARFVSASVKPPVTIELEMRDEESVQLDVERIKNLTRAVLVNLHRFTRLWRRLPWSIGELDMLASQLWRSLAGLHLERATDEYAQYYDQVTAEELGRLVIDGLMRECLPSVAVACLSGQDRLGVSLEEVCALELGLSSTPCSEGAEPFFDRLFNLPPFVRAGDEWPMPDTAFIHPAFGPEGVSKRDTGTLQRLLGGLRIGDEALCQLLERLGASLDVDPGSGDGGGWNLSAANLSLLYRHTRLAEILELSIPELFQLVQLATGKDFIGNHVLARNHAPDREVVSAPAPSDVETLLDFHDWWRTTSYSLDDLGYVTGRTVLEPGAYPDPERIAEELIEEVRADGALVFADTVFAFFEGVEEKQSRALIAANAACLERLPEGAGHRLAWDFGPSRDFHVPAALSRDLASTGSEGDLAPLEGRAREALFRYHVRDILPSRLAEKLGLPAEKIAVLISMAQQSPVGYAYAQHALLENAAATPILDLVTRLLPFLAEPMAKSLVAEAQAEEAWSSERTVANHLAGQLGGSAEQIEAAIRRLGFDLSEPRYLEALRGKSSPPDAISHLLGELLPALDAAPLAASLIETTQAGGALHFTAAVFESLEGVDEGHSRALIDANEERLEHLADGGYRLPWDFDPTVPLVVPDGFPAAIDAGETMAALMGHHGSVVILEHLAGSLGLSQEEVGSSIGKAGIDLWFPAYRDALLGIVPAAPIRDLIGKLLPLTVLFRGTELDVETLEFVRDNPGIFGVDSFRQLTPEIVRGLSIVNALVGRREESRYTTGDKRVEPKDVRAVLAGFDQADAFAAVESEQLARVIGAQSGLVATVRAHVRLPEQAPAALAKLERCVALARELGVSGELLKQMTSWESDDLASAADGMFGAFRARYSDEQQWREELEPFEAAIRGRKRDALVDFLLRSPGLFPEFQRQGSEPSESASGQPGDLYHYFLIDPQVEGCATISRVVAAISSVQLYVHRILLNLEQDRAGLVRVALHDDEKKEWEWRKSYRVWEANRKVFLYPENYLEPELRGDKTPLFEELESELLQQEITEQTVLDAYGTYMRGFEEVASLKIAGACHEVNVAATDSNEEYVLHLFGATAVDPPTFYYRSVENANPESDSSVVFNPWYKIDVQIPVQEISPVIYQGRLHVFWAEITSRPAYEVEGGAQLTGYQHAMKAKFTSLRLDGTWTTPQQLSLPSGEYPFFEGSGVIMDRFSESQDGTLDKVPRLGSGREHNRPDEGYTLEGPAWNVLYLDPCDPAFNGRLSIAGRNFLLYGAVDIYNRRVEESQAPIWPYRGIRWCLLVSRDAFGTLSLGSGVRYNGIWTTIRGEEFVGGLFSSDVAFSRMLFEEGSWENTKAEVKADGAIELAFEETVLGEYVDRIYFEGTGVWFPDSHQTIGRLQREVVAAPVLRPLMPGVVATSEPEVIATSEPEVIATSDVILQKRGDSALLQPYLVGDDLFEARCRVLRLGAGLDGGSTLGEKVSSGGIDGLLNVSFQRLLKSQQEPEESEEDSDLLGRKLSSLIEFDDLETLDGSVAGLTAPGHAYGVYYREIFFHIPFLIANHLNSRQRFAAAQRWYHYVFDPTASPEEPSNGHEKEHFWRTLYLRNGDVPTLKDILEDTEAVEAYRGEPANPHAIARLRPSAYQKAIVMKYIDNLLDWGDSQFSQFTMESVNEATLLYALATDILGERPVELGECREVADPFSYQEIEPLEVTDERTNEFLMELENGRPGGGSPAPAMSRSSRAFRAAVPMSPGGAGGAGRTYCRDRGGRSTTKARRPATGGRFRGMDWKQTTIAAWHATTPGSMSRADVTPIGGHRLQLIQDWSRIPSFGLSLIDQIAMSSPGKQAVPASADRDGGSSPPAPVFCIPPNEELRAYWDRVEDRLYKIRHCMDIKGVRRELALFAPEIDPRLLVRAKAAGLSLEDVLAATSGNLPPYRFTYLIAKAKELAGTVQAFGNALLSALEKKDAEELSQLRSVHEQNLLSLTRWVKQREIRENSEAIASLERQRAAARYRQGHFQGLLDGDLTGGERAQQIAQHIVPILGFVSGYLELGSSVAHLSPEYGAPIPALFGGKQVGDSLSAASRAVGAAANVAQGIASSTGLEAGFDRRRKEWKHQRKIAEHDLAAVEKQLVAAEIRKEIAEKSLEIHEKSIEQAEEIFDLYADKFSNLGLYTWLSTRLQRLYREAYNSAYAMARLSEQAFRFERGELSGSLEGGCWEASKAGLLAGERLLVELQNLERRFLETDFRALEITQSFSLAQVDPAALVYLRATGTTAGGGGDGHGFVIPELFFDLVYPGHYRRRIKAVRLTIPCVTGPYTNVGATLRLLSSEIRTEPKLDDEHLEPVPLQRTVTIATSNAQNDAGVFELSFRDERYMPFEGAGAVNSEWQLELPRSFRPFDYDTISDVILTLSYTAEEDGKLREQVEGLAEGLESALIDKELAQVLSLRYQLPNAWHQFFHPSKEGPKDAGDQADAGGEEGAGGQEGFERRRLILPLTQDRFPFFVQGKTVTIQKMELFVKLDPDHSGGYDESTVKLSLIAGTEPSEEWMTLQPPVGDVLHGEMEMQTRGQPGTWTLSGWLEKGEESQEHLKGDAIQDILLVCRYTCS